MHGKARGTAMHTILVVEDNEESRDMLSRRLQRRGYAVIVATDGERAVSMAREAMPDLILMDMNLPKMDGWEATRQLRATPETRAVPVIALTAHAMTGDREKTLAAGCNDYHPKPVELVRLLAQIEKWLAHSQDPRVH